MDAKKTNHTTDLQNVAQLRYEIEDAVNYIAKVRSLYNTLHEHEIYGEYFDKKLSSQVDQLTQIALTLGEVYGYSMANERLNKAGL